MHWVAPILWSAVFSVLQFMWTKFNFQQCNICIHLRRGSADSAGCGSRVLDKAHPNLQQVSAQQPKEHKLASNSYLTHTRIGKWWFFPTLLVSQTLFVAIIVIATLESPLIQRLWISCWRLGFITFLQTTRETQDGAEHGLPLTLSDTFIPGIGSIFSL